jgi:ribonuclease HI
VIEATELPPRTSSQQTELIVLTGVLKLAKDKIINIYTDSKYAYNIIHSNVLIWRERGFLTQEGTPIINGDLIDKLFRQQLSPLGQPSCIVGDTNRMENTYPRPVTR